MRFLFVLSGLLALTTVMILVAGGRREAGAVVPAIFAIATYIGATIYRSKLQRESGEEPPRR
jgi:hypothetical protein